MADDLATLQANLAALREVRALGARAVQVRDERTEFRSDSELAVAIGDLERRIAVLSGCQPVKMVVFATSKGL